MFAKQNILTENYLMSEKYDFTELDLAMRKCIVMSRFEHDQEKYENLKNGAWILDLEETEDGSGDAILNFPDELVILNGWKEGTILNMEAKDSTIIITVPKDTK